MDELKKKEVVDKQQQVKNEDELKVTSFSLEDFLGEDYKQLDSEENQEQKDIQAGDQIVKNAVQMDEWEVLELPAEKTLDEQLIEARRSAHSYEKNVAPIKKSTLKKRRAEYAKKNAEHETMSAAREQIKEFRSGETRKQLKNEFFRHAKQVGQDLLHDHVSDKFQEMAMDAVMYFQKKENLDMGDMSVMFRDLCFNVEKTDNASMKDMNNDQKKRVQEQFGGKMALYEKLFSEALSWDPEEFAIKGNHALAEDPKFTEKMEKLTLIPMLREALYEYDQMQKSGRMESMRGNDKKAFMPEELMNELKIRLEYYENVQNEMETRMDLMANKYYALLGKSDTANIDVLTLGRYGDLENSRLEDREMVDYYNAIYRSKAMKHENKELKGKSPAAALDRIRKSNKMATGKTQNAKTKKSIEEFSRVQKITEGNVIRNRRRFAFERGELNADKFDFMSEETVNFQIEAVHKSLGIELSQDEKQGIQANFKSRLADSLHARNLLDTNVKRRKVLMEKMEKMLLEEFPKGFKLQVREEREGILEHLLSDESEDMSIEDQYQVYRTVMLPYVNKEKQKKTIKSYTNKNRMSPDDFDPDDIDEKDGEEIELEEIGQGDDYISEETVDTILDVFKQALTNDNQLDILSKYNTPQEFAAKATQEEFNKLMYLFHIGAWVNQLIFERKNKDFIEELDDDEDQIYKDFYVKLAKAGYEFGNAVFSMVELMASPNYAFMSDATIEKLPTTNPKSKVSSYMKDRQNMINREKGNFRIGKNAAKRMKADEKAFDESPEFWKVFAKTHDGFEPPLINRKRAKTVV